MLTTDRNDPGLHVTLPNGQQEKYLVLSEEEIAQGFVEPLRLSYKHSRCGQVTTMGIELCKTYARQPEFYGATFCSACHEHFPVGIHGEFVWTEDGTLVGTRSVKPETAPTAEKLDEVELYVAQLNVANIRLAIQKYGIDIVLDDITAGLSKAIRHIEDGDNREVVELVGVIHTGEQTNAQDQVDPAPGV